MEQEDQLDLRNLKSQWATGWWDPWLRDSPWGLPL